MDANNFGAAILVAKGSRYLKDAKASTITDPY